MFAPTSLRRFSRMSLLTKFNVSILVFALIVIGINAASAATTNASFSVGFVIDGTSTPVSGSSQITVRPGPGASTVGQSSYVTGASNTYSFTKTGTWGAGAHFTIPSGYSWVKNTCSNSTDVSNDNYVHVPNSTSSSELCYIFIKSTGSSPTTPPTQPTTPPSTGNTQFAVGFVIDGTSTTVIGSSQITVRPAPSAATITQPAAVVAASNPFKFNRSGNTTWSAGAHYTIPSGYTWVKNTCSKTPDVTNDNYVHVPNLTGASELCYIFIKASGGTGTTGFDARFGPVNSTSDKVIVGEGFGVAHNITNKTGGTISQIDVKVEDDHGNTYPVATKYTIKNNESETVYQTLRIPNLPAGTVLKFKSIITGKNASGATVNATVTTGGTVGNVLTRTIVETQTCEDGQEMATCPTAPPTQPTRPPTQPTTPPTQPTTPPTQPTTPPTQPTTPPTQPTTPPTQPTTPPTQPTTPPTQPTMTIPPCHNPSPGTTCPTTPPTQPTTPDSQPSTPTSSSQSTSKPTSTVVPVSVRGTQVTNTAPTNTVSTQASSLPFTGRSSLMMAYLAVVLIVGGYVVSGTMKHLAARNAR